MSRDRVRRGSRQGEVRYLTDDSDVERNELAVFQGGNGDWYVGVMPEGEAGIGCFVRVTTSGSPAPGAGPAIARLYAALVAALPAGERGDDASA